MSFMTQVNMPTLMKLLLCFYFQDAGIHNIFIICIVSCKTKRRHAAVKYVHVHTHIETML